MTRERPPHTLRRRIWQAGIVSVPKQAGKPVLCAVSIDNSIVRVPKQAGKP